MTLRSNTMREADAVKQITRKDAIAYAISVTVAELKQLDRQIGAKRARLDHLRGQQAKLSGPKFVPFSYRAAVVSTSPGASL